MGVNQGLGLVLRLDSLEITGACLSSKEERVVLYEINREPRDVGGLVMRVNDLPYRGGSSILAINNIVAGPVAYHYATEPS